MSVLTGGYAVEDLESHGVMGGSAEKRSIAYDDLMSACPIFPGERGVSPPQHDFQTRHRHPRKCF